MGQLAADNFNRANSGTLGANWTKLSGFSDLTIVSNQCKASAGTSCVDAYTGSGAVAVDQYAQCIMMPANDGGPTVRSNTTSTFYLLDYESNAFNVYKCISGSFTELNSVAVTPNNGDTLYIEVQGTTIITKQNGTTRNNFTDSAINGTSVGGPYPGLYAFSDSIILDDFAMGNFITFPGGDEDALWYVTSAF